MKAGKQLAQAAALDFSQLFGELVGENRPATAADTPQTDSREYSSPTPWENPAEGQETPHSATSTEAGPEIPAPAFSLQAEQAAAAAKRTEEAFREIEQNRRRSESLRAELLKGTRSGGSIYRLFLVAVETISEMTRNRAFYQQIYSDVLTVYGRGLGEPEPLGIELDRTRQQLHHLQEAQERETDPDSLEHIAAAIRAHRAKIKALEERIAAA